MKKLHFSIAASGFFLLMNKHVKINSSPARSAKPNVHRYPALPPNTCRR
jgi:hypothetical protein